LIKPPMVHLIFLKALFFPDLLLNGRIVGHSYIIGYVAPVRVADESL